MPKLLIISNTALSLGNSNGRTMLNFLGQFAPEEIAQFFIHGDPDFSACMHYYRITDFDAFNAVKHFRRPKKSGLVSGPETQIFSSTYNKNVATMKIKRNCRNSVLRDIIWCSFKWWNQEFDTFLSDFSPNAVLLQAGDCPFMFAIARKISLKLHIPLFMYNSEGYILKKYLYNGISKADFWHFVLQKRLKKEYKKFMDLTDHCFYITEYLEQCYQQKYPHPGKSTSLCTSSDMHLLEDKSGSPFRIVYCGNLGVGRVEPLGEVADVLASVNSEATLDIYGRFISEEEKETLCAHRNVRFFGIVPYDEIPRIMSEANLLLHCEAANRFDDLRYAFSTKIADSLASGRPFLVYAVSGYPFVQYLKEHNAAHIATNKDDLFVVLQNCLKNKAYLNSNTTNAILLATERHSKAKNSSVFFDIINDVCIKAVEK